jgi:microcin C transport system substrate-binding protein
VQFRLNPKARFSDGSPVRAEDVKFSFDTLMSMDAHPHYRFYWADLGQCVIVDELTVRFDFKKVNRELHMIAGQIPVFSKKWLADGDLKSAVLKAPISSGAYTIKKYDLGKTIVYERNPDYWAKDLNTRVGQFNFDQIVIKYYKDPTIALEALKAGDFDVLDITSSKQWARDMKGDKFDDGRLKTALLKHSNNAGMQGFVFNLRRPLFQDIAVRRAINLAFDFEWTNEKLFFKQYTRSHSYFSNSVFASSGLPEGDELALLEPFRSQLPTSVFTQAWQSNTTAAPSSLRHNLRAAKKILNEAGWSLNKNKILSKNGIELKFEVLLIQKAFERVMAPFARNLKRLGIEVRYRKTDNALYKQRLDDFNFDMIVMSYGQSQSPGNEQRNYWHSSSLAQKGARNFMGLNNPVIDSLVEKIIAAKDYVSLQTTVKALDRVLLHGEYLVPNWYMPAHRLVYHKQFALPKTLPLYYNGGEDLIARTGWIQ